jgi:hypothetical protein
MKKMKPADQMWRPHIFEPQGFTPSEQDSRLRGVNPENLLKGGVLRVWGIRKEPWKSDVNAHIASVNVQSLLMTLARLHRHRTTERRDGKSKTTFRGQMQLLQLDSYSVRVWGLFTSYPYPFWKLANARIGKYCSKYIRARLRIYIFMKNERYTFHGKITTSKNRYTELNLHAHQFWTKFEQETACRILENTNLSFRIKHKLKRKRSA